MYYLADSQKQVQWEAELAGRVEIEPEELLAFFDPVLIKQVDDYQVKTASSNLVELIKQPVHDPKNSLEMIMSNNTTVYNMTYQVVNSRGEIEVKEFDDLLYTDPLLEKLANIHEQHKSDDNYSRLVRSRRTVVAHYIFSMIIASQAAAA